MLDAVQVRISLQLQEKGVVEVAMERESANIITDIPIAAFEERVLSPEHGNHELTIHQ